MNKKKILISIVVPVVNEEHVIEAFINELIKELSKLEYAFEIIIIDDGSNDKTSEIIKKLQKKHSIIRLLSFTRNFGHQSALFAGIKHSSGSTIIMMDGDLQHPPSLISKLLKEWESGAKVVQTIRKDIRLSLFKRITSKIFYFLINFLSDVKLNPASADFRLIDKDVVRELMRFKESDIFMRGLIPWLGFETKFVKYNAEPRFGGKSKYSVLKMITFALSGITSFSTLPLKLTIIAGLIISILSFYFGLDSIYARLFTNRVVPGWTSIMVGVFFIGGLLLIFLGVLGTYLGKIYIQVKNRPKYIIKELSGFENKK